MNPRRNFDGRAKYFRDYYARTAPRRREVAARSARVCRARRWARWLIDAVIAELAT
jgi:hypothetical protein